MFCIYCGNALEEDALFCDKCGKAIGIAKKAIVETAKSSTTNNQLIYESRGISRWRKVVLLICGLILICLGIVVIVLSHAEYASTTVHTLWGTGTIGGGYVFNEEGRMWLLIGGILIFSWGLETLFMLFCLSRSIFRIYEDHIEACYYYTALIITLKKQFYLEYNQIVEVQLIKGGVAPLLTIITYGDKYALQLLRDADFACNYIRERIKR